MTRGRDGEGVDDLQVGREVGLDAGVEDGEVEEADPAAGEDGAVREQAQGEEGVGREALDGFPRREEQKADAADDEHGDDASIVPSAFCRGGKCKWYQYERNRCRQEKETHHVKLVPDRPRTG